MPVDNMKIIYDTSSIIAEGGINSDGSENLEIVLTSYTQYEIQTSKKIEEMGIDISTTGYSVIFSPRLHDFQLINENLDTKLYMFYNEQGQLQLLEYNNSTRYLAECEKHETKYQLSLIGGGSINLCAKVVNSDADFSQINCMVLYKDIIHKKMPDNCLRKSIEKI